MKIALLIGTVAGFLLLVWLAFQADLPAMLSALTLGGWELLWLLPYRALFFALYAWGWSILLYTATSKHPVAFGYVFWVTTVREAVDRLMPVASVGGSFLGVRLMRWRGVETADASASVLLEIVLTLVASYLFAAAGLVLLEGVSGPHRGYGGVWLVLLLSLPIPLVMILVLRYGSIFERIEHIASRFSGLRISVDGATKIDHAVRSLLRTRARLILAGALDLMALICGCFEVWFAMRLFGRPVSIAEAVILESMTVALRHVAFIVPAGIGVQEAGLVTFGRALGIDSEYALAVSGDEPSTSETAASAPRSFQ